MSCAAGMRARTRSRRVPVTTSAAHAATPTAATVRSQRGPDGRREPARVAPRLERDDDRACEDEQREQEVRHHRDRVEVEEHRDAAERDLRDRAERR